MKNFLHLLKTTFFLYKNYFKLLLLLGVLTVNLSGCIYVEGEWEWL